MLGQFGHFLVVLSQTAAGVYIVQTVLDATVGGLRRAFGRRR